MLWLLGLDWTPYRPLDAEAESTSELAGVVRPALVPHVGLRADRNTWILGAGLAREVDVRREGESRRVRKAQAGLRLALDWQRELPVASPFVLWAGLGVSGVVPWASETDTGADAQTQESLDEAARARMARTASLGGRVGVGVEWPVNPNLSVGGRAALVGLAVPEAADGAWLRSSILNLETGLRVQVSW